MKNNSKRRFLPFAMMAVLSIALTSGAYALWQSSMEITGAVTWDSGSQPETQTCNISFSGTGDGNMTQDCSWENSDGDVSMQFVCDSSAITSTDSRCNYEDGKDVKLWLSEDNGATWQPCDSTPTYNMEPGINNITVMADPHPLRCPISGEIELSGALV